MRAIKFIRPLITLVALLLYILSQGQVQTLDTTVFLQIGEQQIESLKRYATSVIDHDTGEVSFDTAPRFLGYHFKNSEWRYIKTSQHFVYLFSEDPDSGNRLYGARFKTDSTFVSKYFGEIGKDQLFEALMKPIFLIDTKREYKINLDFTVEISSTNEYIKILRAQKDFQLILAYELELLEKGDKVFIRDLNFNCEGKPSIGTLNVGYWTIN